jgi:mannose-6-phosphate isomerase-like protein (cupin superfamily)
MIKSTQNAEHYIWGNQCDGWHLLKSDTLSVIQERMPPGTAEQLHFHHKAQQLFYILTGEATFEMEGNIVTVKAGESLHIPALTKHRIINKGSGDITFIVVSEPKSHGDRENLQG